MALSDSPSTSSDSQASQASGGHPLDAALRRRAAAKLTNAFAADVPLPTSVAPRSSSPESGEVPNSTEAIKQAKNGKQASQKRPHLAGRKRQRAESAAGCSAGWSTALERSSSSDSEHDLDAHLACGSDISSDKSGNNSRGSDSEDVRPAMLAAAPTGVILVEQAEERNAALLRLLRAPRCAETGLSSMFLSWGCVSGLKTELPR